MSLSGSNMCVKIKCVYIIYRYVKKNIADYLLLKLKLTTSIDVPVKGKLSPRLSFVHDSAVGCDCLMFYYIERFIEQCRNMYH